jgi:hypothetical protein
LAGKHRRTPFPRIAKFRADKLLELVHGDLCGPITPATPSGKTLFLLLVDDKSRYMWLTLLEKKSDAAEAIKRFRASAELESGQRLRTLRTDRGGEFTSARFLDYCADLGIKRHLTAPYSPQQNGVVERRNQTIVGMARSLLKAKNMPGMFWGEAVSTAVYLLNRAPTQSVTGMTPYEAWHGARPDVSHLRTFGCIAHVKDVRPLLKKLEDRSRPMVFLGYEQGSKAYRCYDPVAKRVCISRDVVFDETAKWNWEEEPSAGESNMDFFTVDYLSTPVPVEQEEDAPATPMSEAVTPTGNTSPAPSTATTPESPRTPPQPTYAGGTSVTSHKVHLHA